jgi:membrane protein YdbS with pleckstrin-like domain
VVVIPKVRWIRWSFEVYDEEIDIYRGIFWRRYIIIPLIRVQNVDTRQGPIMRANGLASFTVATAAGEHEIPGLKVAEADALRDHVALLARIAQEDV